MQLSSRAAISSHLSTSPLSSLSLWPWPSTAPSSSSSTHRHPPHTYSFATRRLVHAHVFSSASSGRRREDLQAVFVQMLSCAPIPPPRRISQCRPQRQCGEHSDGGKLQREVRPMQAFTPNTDDVSSQSPGSICVFVMGSATGRAGRCGRGRRRGTWRKTEGRRGRAAPMAGFK